MTAEEKAKEFLQELMKLYDKYELSIGHEDEHGAFIIEADSEINRKWISNAHVESLKHQ